MKKLRNIIITCLFIFGYTFSTQSIAGQVSTSPTMSEEELAVQDTTDQTECGMDWNWS